MSRDCIAYCVYGVKLSGKFLKSCINFDIASKEFEEEISELNDWIDYSPFYESIFNQGGTYSEDLDTYYVGVDIYSDDSCDSRRQLWSELCFALKNYKSFDYNRFIDEGLFPQIHVFTNDCW